MQHFKFKFASIIKIPFLYREMSWRIVRHVFHHPPDGCWDTPAGSL